MSKPFFQIRTCLAVDTVEHPIPEVWSSDPADLRALIASLRRIRSLQADYVVLAHGQSADPAIVDANSTISPGCATALPMLS